GLNAEGLTVEIHRAPPKPAPFIVLGIACVLAAIVLDYKLLRHGTARTYLAMAAGFTLAFALDFPTEGAGPHNLVRPAIAAALLEVAADAAEHAQVGVGVDEELDVHQPAQALVDEHQDALDDDHPRGLDATRVRPPRVHDEVVDGHVGRLAATQALEVADE